MLYLVTETEDGEESYTRLSDYKHEPVENERYKLEIKEATYEEVTIDMILDAVEGELENANHHSETEIPNWLYRIMRKHLNEEQIKKIFWDMTQDKGLLWF